MLSVSVTSSQYAQNFIALHLPRYDELPKLDLYMDQIIQFLEETLQPFSQPNEKIITRSMVNNYVKQGVLASATDKKYKRMHLAYLIVICTLKQTFSISEIENMINIQIKSFDTHTAYDYYCDALESALQALFQREPNSPCCLTPGLNEGDFERDIVLSCTAAVAYTLYTKTSITVALD